MNHLAQKMNEKGIDSIHLPTKEQEEILSNPQILTTFIYLIDNPSTINEISRKTKLSSLATSVYLDSLERVKLITKEESPQGNSKSIVFLYKVVDPYLDLSGLTNKLNPITTLDLLYNKIRSDITRLNETGFFQTNSIIKYSQVRVKKGTYPKVKALMHELENLIKENEVDNGEAVTLLQVAYQLNVE
jgi:DNA-binding transcriptional ArsR family regulator